MGLLRKAQRRQRPAEKSGGSRGVLRCACLELDRLTHVAISVLCKVAFVLAICQAPSETSFADPVEEEKAVEQSFVLGSTTDRSLRIAPLRRRCTLHNVPCFVKPAIGPRIVLDVSLGHVLHNGLRAPLLT